MKKEQKIGKGIWAIVHTEGNVVIFTMDQRIILEPAVWAALKEYVEPTTCRFCGDTDKFRELDSNGNCPSCVAGMARTNGD